MSQTHEALAADEYADHAATSAEVIARVCHEANRAWCEANGDMSQKPWDEAEQWQCDSAVEGVAVAVNGATPAELHQAWCDAKTRDGWVYGEVKDAAAKRHPCLRPYDELPEDQRRKDALFASIVRALAGVEPSVVEQIASLEAAIRNRQASGWGDPRELAISLTALEDCQMRFTRGRAKASGVFKPVDLERVEARAERERFEARCATASQPVIAHADADADVGEQTPDGVDESGSEDAAADEAKIAEQPIPPVEPEPWGAGDIGADKP